MSLFEHHSTCTEAQIQQQQKGAGPKEMLPNWTVNIKDTFRQNLLVGRRQHRATVTHSTGPWRTASQSPGRAGSSCSLLRKTPTQKLALSQTRAPDRSLYANRSPALPRRGFPFLDSHQRLEKGQPLCAQEGLKFSSALAFSQAPSASCHLGSCRSQKDINLPHIRVPLGRLSSTALVPSGAVFYFPQPQGLV